MRQPDPLVLSKEATDRFNLVSSDLALGHVKKAARGAWFVTDPDLDAAQQDDSAAARARRASDPGSAERPASDPSAICGAQGGAGNHAGDRHRQASAVSASTWTAGAGCRATSARNTSSSTCPASTPPWSKTASTGGSTGDRGRDQDADAATFGDGGRRDAQSFVGSAPQHHPRSRRARRASCRS